ncbi:MAG: SDR family oxidoreductase [Burkholderiales bacterium]|nr:SDR family oxidoreductase [Burkholderiales bacterium]
MPLALVIGASRGIGLELVRQYRADGWAVVGTARDEKGLERLRALGAEALTLDVNAPQAPQQLERALGTRALDVAILSAGVYGPRTEGLEPPDEETFLHVMRTNVLSAMRIAPRLLSALERGKGRFAMLSSRMGAIGPRRSSFGWLYRASKAARNSVLKDVALQAGRRGICCVALYPGWVRTDMGGKDADIDVETSVAGLRRTLAGVDASQNGLFLAYDGGTIPW